MREAAEEEGHEPPPIPPRPEVPELAENAVQGFYLLSSSRNFTDFGAPVAFPLSEIVTAWTLLGELGERMDFIVLVQAMDGEWRKLVLEAKAAESESKDKGRRQ